jgi:hypothetical protein
MNLIRFALYALGFSFFVQTSAFAYPELIRHGYVNCTACHVSPAGGGVLTPYGRELSSEVLSTWGSEQEKKVADFITQPENLYLGGDYRSVYYTVNNPAFTEGQTVFMQADLEAAFQFASKWYVDGTLGYSSNPKGQGFSDFAISRQHYLMYRPTEEISIRAGRFYPMYGINTPNHSILIRSALDVHSPEGQSEAYNLEASYIGENYNFYLTGIFGRPDKIALQREKGVSAVASRTLNTHAKVGVSYLYGANELSHRSLMGPFAMIGFTEKLYLLAEFDFQNRDSLGWGFVTTNRLGYEIFKGFHIIADQEYGRVDFDDIKTLNERYGLGVWWWPRPHFEFSLEYQTRLNNAVFSTYYDYAYLLWHVYL